MVPRRHRSRRTTPARRRSRRTSTLNRGRGLHAERLEARWLLTNDFYAVPGTTDDLVQLQFNYFSRETSYKNSIGVYQVDNASGAVDGIQPGAAGYAQNAFGDDNFFTVFDTSDGPGNNTLIEVPGGQSYGFFLIANGTVDDLLDDNPTNTVGNAPVAFFTFPDANPDGLDHAWVRDLNGAIPISGRSIRFEDSVGLGDGDYDDAFISFYFAGILPGANQPSNTPPSFNVPGAAPESLEDAGPITVANFATNISPGPASEANQNLTFQITNNSNAALFSTAPAIAADGTLTYEAAPDANGTATITVQLMDDGGGNNTSDPQQFDITVNPVNDAPSFTVPDDAPASNEDGGPMSIANFATNISAGPTDESSHTLTFKITDNTNTDLFTTAPSIAADGTLTYEAAPDRSGTAIITVELMDDGGTADGGVDTSASQQFTITVNPVNDAPSFTIADDPPTIVQSAGAQSIANFAADISPGPADEANQALNFSVVINASTGNLSFEAVPVIDATTGELTYTATEGTFGTATFDVTLMDDGGTANGGVDTSASQQFTITVVAPNSAPVFTLDSDPPASNEDEGPITVSAFATNIGPGAAADAGQQLTFVVDSNTNEALFATPPAIDPATGDLTYEAAPDANGEAVITVFLMDDGGTDFGGDDTSDTQQFTITVNPVNDAPAFTIPDDSPVSNEDDGPVVIANFVTDISAGPADEAAQNLTFEITDNSNPDLFSTAPSISADGTLSYEAASDANGSATITVRLMDDGGTDNGGVDTSATQQFTITVTPVNDAPSFLFDEQGVSTSNEDEGPVTEPGVAISISPGPADESGQALTFIVTDNSNESLFETLPQISSDGTLTYTAAPDANGTATITVVLMDDGGTENGGTDTSQQRQFLIEVLAVNDAPSFTIPGDTAISVRDTGPQSFPDFATDISPGPADESGQQLQFNIVGNDNPQLFSVAPVISADGTLTYTSSEEMTGSAVITVELMDDGGTTNGGEDTSTTQQFTITVRNPNNEPSFTIGDDPPASLEDGGPMTIPAFATNIDPGGAEDVGQVLTFIIDSNSNPDLFLTPPAIDPVTGDLTYEAAPDANGMATIAVVLMDDGGTAGGGDDTTDPQQFTITVTPVNDAPSFSIPVTTITIAANAGPQEFLAFLEQISTGPANEAGQAITLGAFPAGTTGDISFDAVPGFNPNTGDLTFTVTDGTSGTATFNVMLSDDGGTDNGGVDTAPTIAFTIEVFVNTAPSFTIDDDPPSSLEDSGPMSIPNFATNISPGEPVEAGQALTFIVDSNSNPDLFTTLPSISSDGTLTYEAAPDANGTADIVVFLMDDGGTAAGGVDTSATQQFTITVDPVNDAPSFTIDNDPPASLEDDGPQTISGFVGNISNGPANEDSQSLSFVIESNDNESLFATLPSIDPTTGDLTYEAAPDANGEAVISVFLMDDGGTDDGGVDTSATQQFTITVTPVNDAPGFNITDDTVNVAVDSGSLLVVDFADQISPGPANESGQNLVFDVFATGTTGDLAFDAAPAIDPTTGDLTFTATDGTSGTATFDVTLADDGGVDDGGVDTSTTVPITINVFVNTAPSFTIDGDPDESLEDGGPMSIPNFATNISPGTTEEADQTLTFIVDSNSNPDLFSTLPAISSDGTLTYEAAPDANGTATIVVFLMDDGGTAGGGSDTSGTQQFDITVLPVNDAPQFQINTDNPVSLEDLGNVGFLIAFNLVPGPSTATDEGAQNLTLEVLSNSNPDLFSTAPFFEIELDAGVLEGTLNFTTATDAFGSADLTYRLVDDGGTDNGGVDASATESLTITIMPQNDEPSFNLAGNPAASLEDGGPMSIPNFATDISPGNAQEASQILTFIINNNSNPDLFSTAPAISSDGTLTYEAAPNANGQATISVLLRDDGGDSGPGDDDTSPIQQFTITVDPVNDAPSFTIADDPPAIIASAGAQSVADFATNIAPGPLTGDDESGQTLTFDVTADGTTGDLAFDVAPAIDEITGELTYTPTAGTMGTATFNVVLTDDGGTEDGGVDTSTTESFTITVNAAGPNTPPNFAFMQNLDPISEDTIPFSLPNAAINISKGGAGEDGQTLTFVLDGDFSSPGLLATGPSVSPDGTLTFELNPDANGLVFATFVLMDNGGGDDTSDPRAFSITVNPVNDAPVFSIPDNTVDVANDAGAQSISNFATNIAVGPTTATDELLAQSIVGFQVVQTNTSGDVAFDVAPTISNGGTLTYTPTAGTSGTATFEVTLSDDGGTTNGGVDVSDPITFTIELTPAPGPLQSNSDDSPASVQDSAADSSLNALLLTPSATPASAASVDQHATTEAEPFTFLVTPTPPVIDTTTTSVSTGDAASSADLTDSALDSALDDVADLDELLTAELLADLADQFAAAV